VGLGAYKGGHWFFVQAVQESWTPMPNLAPRPAMSAASKPGKAFGVRARSRVSFWPAWLLNSCPPFTPCLYRTNFPPSQAKRESGGEGERLCVFM
jgi:hypothetical protein